MKRQWYILTNRSHYSNEELYPLLDLAWRVAWIRKTPSPFKNYRAVVKKTRHNYCGSAVSSSCTLRFGPPSKPITWPLTATYAKFKDMPEHFLNSWREVIVHLAAHEFAHLTGYDGRKNGEFMCEMTAWDAVDAYRKEQQVIDNKIDSALEAKRDRENKLAHRKEVAQRWKQSPDYKLQRLATQEKDWLRKLRLAMSKMKKIKRSRSAILAHQRRASARAMLVPQGETEVVQMAAKPSSV